MTFASSSTFIVEPYQLEINTFLQIQPPIYLNINDCLYVESQTSWQTIKEIANKINHWRRFEVKKVGGKLSFFGEICK